MLGDAEPALCQHCKQYGFECTFFLPITETRFKKKRLEEEAAAAVEKAEAEKRETASPREAGPSRPETRVYGASPWPPFPLPPEANCAR